MTQDAPETDVVKAGDKPTLAAARFPFLPWGLAPLIGLGLVFVAAVFPFAFGEVEAATAAATRKALQDGGYGWVSASVSGQWVTVEGKPPSRAEADKAIAAISRARAPTFFGEAEPATWVIDRFTFTEDPLRPLDDHAPPAIPDTTRDRPDAQASLPPPRTAADQRCDQSMADLLRGATIEFATNSAVIRPGSNDLLDGIARAADACPGRLRIGGHTDNEGRSAFNTTLSLRRAEAVRTALIRRGVEAGRLVAEGFGSSQPVATNETEAGRARNRRIEIRAVGASPN